MVNTKGDFHDGAEPESEIREKGVAGELPDAFRLSGFAFSLGEYSEKACFCEECERSVNKGPFGRRPLRGLRIYRCMTQYSAGAKKKKSKKYNKQNEKEKMKMNTRMMNGGKLTGAIVYGTLGAAIGGTIGGVAGLAFGPVGAGVGTIIGAAGLGTIGAIEGYKDKDF